MLLQIHPEAAVNFNQKAEGLVSKLEIDPYQAERHPRSSFLPEINIREVKASNIVNTGYSDDFGNEIAKIFKHETDFVGLFEDNYKDLVRLGEAIYKNKSIRDRVSLKLIVQLIFEWIEMKFKQTASLTMVEYLIAECETKLREIEIWLPIAMLAIQSPFEVGKVVLKPITKEMLEVWFNHLRSDEGFRPESEARLEEWRSKFQGFAAATIKTLAEPIRASQIAIEEAERALSMLRFFPLLIESRRVFHTALYPENFCWKVLNNLKLKII
ncbi:MAG TPA: hypothetical protein VF604_19495 [Pyrinomonadaceae bacterium]|jgi:hypothetical protein